MQQEDMITGEPIQGSPSSMSEYEAANMASFGQYSYNPNARAQQMMQPVSIYPGNYGYNGGMEFMNPPGYYNYNYNYYPQQGLGSPYRYNAQPTYQQYYNQYGYQSQWNNAYQNPMMQQQVPTTYQIPGYNPSGNEYLAPMDIEDQIERLKYQCWNESIETEAKKTVDSQNNFGYSYNGYYGYNNYYGTPYYSQSTNYALDNAIRLKVEEIKNQARQNRLDFNMNLSRLAHNINHDGVGEDVIQERYTGRVIDVPQAYVPTTPEVAYKDRVLSNLEPWSNAAIYNSFHAQVSKEFNDIIPPDSNMYDTFLNMGVVKAKWEMDDEMHRRRNGKNLYQSGDNGYRYFVRKKAEERYARERGFDIQQSSAPTQQDSSMGLKQAMLNQFPVLSQNAELEDDGTLTIKCNFGSHAGESYTVHNSQEAGYEAHRQRYYQFVNSIPNAIYSGG